MKPYTNLYPKICAWENLELAYYKARRGKRGLAPAASFERKLEDNLVALQDALLSQTYAPGKYHSFYIHDPKKRLISAAPFRDRVVHHALCNIIEPIFERSFIDDSYANRVGQGTHRALDRCQQFSRRYRYALQLDVVQYFPGIDHAILRETLARRIGDEAALRLCEVIIESGRGVLAEEYNMVYFDGDDPSTGSGQGLLAVNRPRGLPIGNLTSQFWANVYLNSFDHFVKRELKCKAYLRYVDDFILFADDKQTLWAWRKETVDYLARLRLTLHIERVHPRPVTEGVMFLGFNVFPTHRLLKAKKAISFRRKLKAMRRQLAEGEIGLGMQHASVRGWVNHVRYGDTWGLRRAILGANPITWN
ncbi:MAG: RNA-dependent DNA polymerase [Chloroflexi bacterium]|nr:RNA-dependent DNA polymerase [Chloroflexota bacterium]